MSKKIKLETPAKQPKTVKVSTLVTTVAVIAALIASFIGGIAYNEHYNNTVEAKALEKVEQIELKLNQQ